MGTVNGNVPLMAGSEDPITDQLLDDNGTTPIDLTGITDLTLWLKNKATGAITSFTGAKLTVTDAVNGKVKLEQVAADFPSAATYYRYYAFNDSSGKAHKVPDGDPAEYVLIVFDNFES